MLLNKTNGAISKLPFDLDALKAGVYELGKAFPWENINGEAIDFGDNILNIHGLLYEPVCDLNSNKPSNSPQPAWPGDAPYAVCLTHDVDLVSAKSIASSLRGVVRTGAFWWKSKSNRALSKIAQRVFGLLQSTANVGRADPLHCFERWLEVEAEHGAKSTFFFFPQSTRIPHWSDCFYRYSDKVVFDGQKCSVKEMMREINRRGWEIGLHASWGGSWDLSELKRQKDELQEALGDEVVSIRNHCLNYHMGRTPFIQAEAGFRQDSTLGFNSNVGFRCGTSYPFYPGCGPLGSQNKALEIPLIIQDKSLMGINKGLRLDSVTAFKYIEMLAAKVKDVGGVLTLLWHPNTVADAKLFDLYRSALQYLRNEGVFFGSAKDIGDHWRTLPHQKDAFPTKGHET